ncbi:MAG: hypothetical protein WCY98_01775 [Castellaniella sp.]
MTFKRAILSLLVPVGALLLTACETVPNRDVAASEPAAQTQAQEMPARQEAGQDGAPVAVFVADTVAQEGWSPIRLNDGELYLNPQPVVTRDDLTGVQAGTNKNGDGLLVLELNAAGLGKVNQATTQFPGKRLALIVGQTLMAVPGYSAPLTTERLAFMVGSGETAAAAAEAIAGTPAGDAPAGAEQGND